MKKVVIYFNKEKTSFQIVRPQQSVFNGDWQGLVEGITFGYYHSYDVID